MKNINITKYCLLDKPPKENEVEEFQQQLFNNTSTALLHYVDHIYHATCQSRKLCHSSKDRVVSTNAWPFLFIFCFRMANLIEVRS